MEGRVSPRLDSPRRGVYSGQTFPAMLYHEQSDDYRPLFWVQGRPIHANTLIIIAHIVSFTVCGLYNSRYGFFSVVSNLSLSTPDIWHGEVWRLFTYVAFDQAFFSQRSLWFLISILLLYFFGREVEQFVGRRAYLKFYAALILVPSVLLSLIGLVSVPAPYLNCGDVIFGVFVAFATIYPGAMPSFWLPLTARALMWILLAMSVFVDLVWHDYTAAFVLCASSAVGYFGMRLIGAGNGMEWFTNWLENRRTEKLVRQRNFKIVQEKQINESIDAILDKISKHGVGSLDSRERASLEKARAKLLKRDER
jgi:membrane associated rhomboid family serine protease